MVSDANTFCREWWKVFIHVDCWGTLRISSRWWICLPIDWFSSRRKISGREETFCAIPENSTCDGSENCSSWSFTEFQFGATHKTFPWARLWFFLEFPKNVFKDFSRAVCFCGISQCELEKLCFPHSFPYSRVIEGRRCVRFEKKTTFWLTWLV